MSKKEKQLMKQNSCSAMVMRRVIALLIGILIFGESGGATPAASPTKEPSKPNIIFFLADDIGMECLGCYGSQFYKTPNIDKLAAGGARFLEAYSEPLCTPSRVQLLTGRHNFRNYLHFGLLDIDQPTFAQSLKKVGYATGISGKWQLTGRDLEGPGKVGFDQYCLWNFMDYKDKKGEGETKENGERYKSPKLFQNGKPMGGNEGKYGPDVTFNFLCDFIKEKKSGPFMAYFTSLLVHSPFDPTPSSKDWEKMDRKVEDLQHFKEMVEYMDGQVGKLVKLLEETGLRENTLIVFTGDNGTHQKIVSPFPGRGQIRGGKTEMIDDGTHVGFIANWPGHIQPGTVVKTQIDFTDVFPTFCAVAGAPMPSNLDGQNLMPFMMGDESQARGYVFQSYSRNGNGFHYFVRQGPYKLYNTGDLFDVPHDWLEKKPLTGPEIEPVRKRLQTILDSYLKDAPQKEGDKRKEKRGGSPEK